MRLSVPASRILVQATFVLAISDLGFSGKKAVIRQLSWVLQEIEGLSCLVVLL